MLWVCERCRTIHSQNPSECRNCGHRILDSMHAREYERKYDEEPPEPVDDAITMGTTPDPNFESSPDVAVDGSINRDRPDETPDAQASSKGILTRLRDWIF